MDKKHNQSIDTIKFINNNSIITKSVDGRIYYWQLDNGKLISEIKVPNCNKQITKFDVSKDGNYICCGNSEGTVYLFNTNTGKQITRLEHKRCRSTVRSCTFTSNSKSIVFINESHLWRFDLDENDKSNNTDKVTKENDQ